MSNHTHAVTEQCVFLPYNLSVQCMSRIQYEKASVLLRSLNYPKIICTCLKKKILFTQTGMLACLLVLITHHVQSWFWTVQQCISLMCLDPTISIHQGDLSFTHS